MDIKLSLSKNVDPDIFQKNGSVVLETSRFNPMYNYNTGCMTSRSSIRNVLSQTHSGQHLWNHCETNSTSCDAGYHDYFVKHQKYPSRPTSRFSISEAKLSRTTQGEQPTAPLIFRSDMCASSEVGCAQVRRHHCTPLR